MLSSATAARNRIAAVSDEISENNTTLTAETSFSLIEEKNVKFNIYDVIFFYDAYRRLISLSFIAAITAINIRIT